MCRVRSTVSAGYQILRVGRVNSALAALPALVLLSGCLPSARVVRVIDGDTFVITGGKSVRLLGIDAPALKEPGGTEASARLRALVAGRTVRLEVEWENRVDDPYGRRLAWVWLDRRLVNEVLVREGHARPRPGVPQGRHDARIYSQ